MESVVVEACKTVPELHIPEDAQPKAKIITLVAGVREAKEEVGRVIFEFNMKIVELQLTLHSMTPSKV